MSILSGLNFGSDHLTDLCRQMERFDLHANLAAFEWNGEKLPEAWRSRKELEQLVRCTPPDQLLSLAETIYKWGFGRPMPKSRQDDPAFLPAILQLFTTWSAEGDIADHKQRRISSLARLLSVSRVGIAQASKWICFIDQSRYAIYDSRVSMALRDIAIEGRRVFPIVARRPVRGEVAWSPDSASLDPKRMAEHYWSYLTLISYVARKTPHSIEGRSLYPAEVEMALFMIGDVWPDPNGRLPLRSVERGQMMQPS